MIWHVALWRVRRSSFTCKHNISGTEPACLERRTGQSETPSGRLSLIKPMFTKRPSDHAWIKYLLSTGLLAVDQLEKMRGSQNQIDFGDLLVRHSQNCENDSGLNQALQQDRFHYIPVEDLDERELIELQQLQPALV